MGGRGTFAIGKKVDFTYKTVGTIEGVKVLEGINGKHGLPEESHTSSAYIKLNHNGGFKELRIYGKDHYLIKEIAYHPEPNLNNGNKKDPILHIHEYAKKGDFSIRPNRLLTQEEFNSYKKYFKGDLKWKAD